MNIDSTVVVASDHLSAAVGDEAVILGMTKGMYYGLDGVGSRIWETIKTPKRVSEIRDEIAREFGVDQQRCAGDVMRFLAELEANGMIEVTPDEQAR
jgi:hypothetical protein